MRLIVVCAFVVLAGLIVAGEVSVAPAPSVSPVHPVLVWSPDELAALRERAKGDAQVQKQLARTAELDARVGSGNPAMLNLVRYAVLGDQAAGALEKQELLRFVGLTAPASGNDDHTLDALRYDLLYDLLSAEERTGVEIAARALIDACAAFPEAWTDAERARPRTGWQPSSQWPAMIGAHVFAVALRDEAQIRRLAAAPGGWQWFLDRYVVDGRFPMEDHGAYASNLGAMILWCDGLERLGLGALGWNATGAGGATLRRILAAPIDAALPGIVRADGGWSFPLIALGDAGRAWLVGSEDNRWVQRKPFGAIPKMAAPLWCEAGHRRFPTAGFDYFLAHLRRRSEETYVPSVLFGLGPIDPAKVAPPPAPSFVARERGFALLRAEESPAYWESPRPAVALQFGTAAVRAPHDQFSLIDFAANNRLLYERLGRTAASYAGNDAWRDHGRGQASAIVVDELQIQPVDDGENGPANQRIRSRLTGPAKFVAVRAVGAFRPAAADVDLERALVLTADYLVDATWLNGSREHVYDWHVIAAGAIPVVQAAAWKPATAFADNQIREQALPRKHLGDLRARDAGADAWSSTILLQAADASADAAQAVGVRVTMLGEPGTVLISGRPPGLQPSELGVKILATRTTAATCFAAIHEPLKGGINAGRIERIVRFGRPADGVALAVTGKAGTGIDDRVIVRPGDPRVSDAAQEPATFVSDGESFTVADHAWIRLSPDRIDAWGDLRALRLRSTGSPRLVVNGVEKPLTSVEGVLGWDAVVTPATP